MAVDGPRERTGDVVEHRGGDRRASAATLVADGEPVGLVPHTLDEVEGLGPAWEHDGTSAARPVELLEALGERDGGDVLHPGGRDALQRRGELPGAPVDDDEVGWVGEPQLIIAFGHGTLALLDQA